jgi:pimeloyl-ACP methyl ester carboxylesterase
LFNAITPLLEFDEENSYKHVQDEPGKPAVPKPQNRNIDGWRIGRTGERPLYFTSSGRPLYGVFHPAAAGGSDLVLVFCHSLGMEHMMTQRMEALAARVAANTGFAAFRYDSRGHGDSAGDAEDVTLDDLVDDACAAADYARELSGSSRIIWAGVRFGCLIAAEAIARRDDAAAVVMWEPLHRGEDYFRAAVRAMMFCQIAEGKRPGTADDWLKRLEAGEMLQVVGSYIYQPLYRTAQTADLSRSLQNWGRDTLIAQVQRRPVLSANNERLRSEIQQRGGKVTVALISKEPGWNMPPLTYPQWTCEPLLAATKEWLSELE